MWVFDILFSLRFAEDVYTVPDPPFSKTPPPVVEVSDLSRADREVDRFTDLEGSHGMSRCCHNAKQWGCQFTYHLVVLAGQPTA